MLGIVIVAACAAMALPIPLLLKPAIAAEQKRPEQSVSNQADTTQGNQAAPNPLSAIPNQGVATPKNDQADSVAPEKDGDGIDWPKWIEAMGAGITGLFTIVLSISTIGLWRQTRASTDIAQRALTDLERPWLATESYKVTQYVPGDQPDAVNAFLLALEWRNVGRAPTIVDECTIWFVEADRLPAAPDYEKAIRLRTQRTARSDDRFTTNEVGPAPDIGAEYRDGTMPPTRWVAFGRITYREMGGTPHQSGYAVEILYPNGTIEVGGPAYNYFR